jgi:hypothetical protein
MKPPKRKELNSPEIETDLSRIQSLSREHDEGNWEFRSWLKQNAPDDIDGIVQALNQHYSALIDCTQCANCCRSLQVEFKKKRASHYCRNSRAIDKRIRETIHVGRYGQSALPDAGWKALFDLRQ